MRSQSGIKGKKSATKSAPASKSVAKRIKKGEVELTELELDKVAGGTLKNTVVVTE
jgi:hypothetical protein